VVSLSNIEHQAVSVPGEGDLFSAGGLKKSPHCLSACFISYDIMAVFSSSKKILYRKKDFPSHQTCDTCIEY
jgi:hypothetical protein